MKLPYRQKIQLFLPYLLCGVIFAVFYLVWLENETPIRGLGLAFSILYLWLFFTLAAYLAWKYLLHPRLAIYTARWKTFWLLGSLLAGYWLADNIPVMIPMSGAVKILLFLSAGAGLGMLLFTASVLLVTRLRPPKPPEEHRLRWLALALPMIVVWVVYLLAFWPGMLSADSLDQWGQMLTGSYNDHHPAFHTFTIWLLTRISLTPAVVAIAQIIALALVAGLALAYIERMGVSSFWIWAASLIFALSPVNATMVITLWKDVPYSTVMLAFTYLILRIVNTRGKWLESWISWVLLGLTAALAGLFRHDGLVVTVTLLLALLLAALAGRTFRGQWKSLAAALVLCLALYYGVTGPVYRLMGVQKPTQLGAGMTSMYTMAATADPGSKVDGVFLGMDPLSNRWQCSVVYKALYEASKEGTGQPESLPVTALHLVEHAPSLLAYDYRCNRSLTWIVWDPNGEVRNPSHAEYWIDANTYGLTPDSKIPAMRDLVSRFVARTAHDPNINWLVWRPAFYLYLFLLLVAIIALRRKNAWLLLIAAPVLLHAISFTLISTPPNFRYHYYTYLLALAFWPILFLPYKPPAGAQEQVETSANGRFLDPEP